MRLTFRDLFREDRSFAPAHFERSLPKRDQVRAFIEQETRKAAALRRGPDSFDFAVIRSVDINGARRQANLFFGMSLKPIQPFAWEGYSPHDCDPLWPLLFDRAHDEASNKYPTASAACLRIAASKCAARWLRAEAQANV